MGIPNVISIQAPQTYMRCRIANRDCLNRLQIQSTAIDFFLKMAKTPLSDFMTKKPILSLTIFIDKNYCLYPNLTMLNPIFESILAYQCRKGLKISLEIWKIKEFHFFIFNEQSK